MNTIEIFIVGTLLAVILGNFIYFLILFPRRLRLSARQKEILTEIGCSDYIDALAEKLQRVNGWLYELIFFSCMHYCFGLWSITFSLLCFLASSVDNSSFYVQLCSVCAAISSCIVLFMNPSEKHKVSQDAWVNGSSLVKDVLLRLPKMDINTLSKELEQLHDQISDISKAVSFKVRLPPAQIIELTAQACGQQGDNTEDTDIPTGQEPEPEDTKATNSPTVQGPEHEGAEVTVPPAPEDS